VNRIVLASWLASFLLGLGSGLTGCGRDPCEELEDRCAQECPEQLVASCRAAVEFSNSFGSNGDRACEQALDEFPC